MVPARKLVGNFEDGRYEQCVEYSSKTGRKRDKDLILMLVVIEAIA